MSDLAALSTANTFNDLARRAATKGSEMLSLIWEAGRIAKAAKESIPHGEWMKFVELHYEVDHRSVTRWIQFHEAVPESKLDTVSNLTEGIKMLDPPKEVKTRETRSDKGKPGGVHQASLSHLPVASGPATEATAAETGPYYCCSAEFGEHEPSCPNYSEDEEQPAETTRTETNSGNVSTDEAFAKQRAKTVKTLEAAMREFDALHGLRNRLDDHDWALNSLRALLQSAKNW